MLHARRKRLQQFAESEDRGESLWTASFGPVARNRLRALVMGNRNVELVVPSVAQTFQAELGIETGIQYLRHLDQFMLPNGCPDELMPSLLEAVLGAFRVRVGRDVADRLAAAINVVLAEERISYELVNGQMVEFESKELHQEVVVPTLRLLSGRPGFDKVEAAYQNALREISEGHAADAITDAGTALQETLTVLACKGNSLGPLIRSARQMGFLGRHDVNLTDGIEKITDWVSADRSEMGDSHKAGVTVTRDDAWLVVHVVGALILRLVGGPRGPSEQ